MMVYRPLPSVDFGVVERNLMRYRADPLCSQKNEAPRAAVCVLPSWQPAVSIRVCPEDLFERQALVESLN